MFTVSVWNYNLVDLVGVGFENKNGIYVVCRDYSQVYCIRISCNSPHRTFQHEYMSKQDRKRFKSK